MTQIAHAFAAAVRAARKRKGFTQLALAGEAKLSLDVVSAIEREVNVPTIETAAKLIKTLGIDAGQVFGATPTPRTVSARRRDVEADVIRLLEGMDDSGAALLLKLAAAVAEAHPGEKIKPAPND